MWFFPAALMGFVLPAHMSWIIPPSSETTLSGSCALAEKSSQGRNIPLPGSGSLFVKSHPNSPWIWVDCGLNSDEKIQRTVCVIAKSDPTKTSTCWEVADYGHSAVICKPIRSPTGVTTALSRWQSRRP
jgi:hypothetical protein